MTEPVTVQMVADQLRVHVKECGQASRETKRVMGDQRKALEELTRKVEAWEATAWKAVGAIALSLLVAVVGVIAQNFVFHNQTITQVKDNAAVVSQKSGAISDAQYHAIMTRLDQMQSPGGK